MSIFNFSRYLWGWHLKTCCNPLCHIAIWFSSTWAMFGHLWCVTIRIDHQQVHTSQSSDILYNPVSKYSFGKCNWIYLISLHLQESSLLWPVWGMVSYLSQLLFYINLWKCNTLSVILVSSCNILKTYTTLQHASDRNREECWRNREQWYMTLTALAIAKVAKTISFLYLSHSQILHHLKYVTK